VELDAVSKKLSIENLLGILKRAEDIETATIMSESLKEIWKAHIDSSLRWKLDTGVSYLLGGDTEYALSIFSHLIAEDPSYAEAWNKASTCEFMLGNMEASLAAAQKSIEHLPTNFQAQNGLGLVYYENKDLSAAAECFRRSMKLDPWSPVSARLLDCFDALEQRKRNSSQEQEP
jgi:tetratricopeptide (TPR) repeat protein